VFQEARIDFAVDTAALAVPYLPAGASKVARLIGKTATEIDPKWASKIIGTGQSTSDAWHQAKSLEIAEEAAKNPAVEKVYLDRAYNTTYGTKGITGQRDDVAVVWKDGHVDHYECVSACQLRVDQEAKLVANRAKAGSEGRDITIEHPSRDPESRLGGKNGFEDTSGSDAGGGSSSGSSSGGGLLGLIAALFGL
jgi:hypothetical protein